MNRKMKILLTGASLTSGNKGINALTLGSIISLYNNNSDIEIELFNQNSRVDDSILHELQIKNSVITVRENYVWSSKFILSGLLHYFFDFFPKIIKKVLFIDCLKLIYFFPVIIQRRKVDFCESSLYKLITADIVINLAEGDSFSDIYGLHVFLRHSLDKIIASSHDVPYMFFPQTLGPFKSSIAIKIARKTLKSAKKIFVREQQSKKHLQELFGKLTNIEEANDMAFLMQPEKTRNIEFEKFAKTGIITGINVSGFLNANPLGKDKILGKNDDYRKITDRIISTLLKLDKKIKIVFLCHVQGEDEEANLEFFEKYSNLGFGDRLFYLKSDYSAPQLKYFLSKMTIFTGARMHACIGALSTGVPTAPQAYSYKFIGITDKFGIGKYVIDLKEDTADIAENKIKSLYKEKAFIKKKLISEFPLIKKDADKCGKSIK